MGKLGALFVLEALFALEALRVEEASIAAKIRFPLIEEKAAWGRESDFRCERCRFSAFLPPFAAAALAGDSLSPFLGEGKGEFKG
ncbi:hypothetical protein [Saccharibacillus brassicae]|uniref:Uncharacterized protein n=1 Tax=Saccharibacillus brassicae TaxID=2583377 RepID=A0A4Y6UXM9_SACBS|nr:hypothetical protein [Saccharibacillus brassicae]QDH22502.1 hypothetical protein FFV09_17635 [Saccharibacillus brassicae]